MTRDEATELIALERKRQLEVLGWTAEHDNQYRRGQLLLAAICYFFIGTFKGNVVALNEFGVPYLWPWQNSWWKPKDEVRNLVRAGALAMAEIDRISRITVCQPNVSTELPRSWLLSITDQLMQREAERFFLKEGDFIKKVKGYVFNGTVQSVFKKRNGTVRYVCENDDGILHIFGPSDITSCSRHA